MGSSCTAVSDIERNEHEGGYGTKKVSCFGWDGSNMVQLKVNSQGELVTNTEPSATDMEGGGKVSVGTTAVEVAFTGQTKSVIIAADTANTGQIYVGKSNVTSAGANAIIFLDPGDSVVIDYDDSTNAVYVVASAISQNFWKGALIY